MLIFFSFTVLSILNRKFLFFNYVNTITYEGWNFNIGNYLFTTDTK